ncbi:MAG: M23 family metallopeptidase [Fidelibacterota bacterium]
MPRWPLKTRQSQLPTPKSAGSFWEDRKDRRHCGIDLYAEQGADVLAIEAGEVVDTGIMTAPEFIHYWNITHYVIVKNSDGTFWKYGEMEDIFVKKGEIISEGQLIGKVGLVLNTSKINESSPLYIQKLKHKNPSMLHLELFSDNPIGAHEKYLGGNWFEQARPKNLLDPADRLMKIE